MALLALSLAVVGSGATARRRRRPGRGRPCSELGSPTGARRSPRGLPRPAGLSPPGAVLFVEALLDDSQVRRPV